MEITNANNCHITGVDKDHICGNPMYEGYIDTTMGSGAQIIGHNNQLIKEIVGQVERGTIYTIPNIHTNKVNSYLKTHINPTFHDKYIYCNSGTEANMRVIR